MASPATRSGDVLNDAYELRELLSSEGPLEVYRARDRRTRSDVHVKLLRAEFALQSQVVENFLRGPRSLSAVTHASLPLVRVDTDDTGIPFVVEEAIEGRALEAVTGSFPQGLPLGMVAQLCVPLAEALALAHDHGLTHGAIDEEHVKVLGTPQAPLPKLIGLGASHRDRSPQHTAYRAPESNRPDARATPQADVYAFGVLLYKMLSGGLPFRSGKKSAVPLEEVAPHLPSAWVKLTAACLQSSQATRVEDAGALLAQLRACTEPPSQPVAIASEARAPRAGEVPRDAVPVQKLTVEAVVGASASASARLDPLASRAQPAHAFEATVPASVPAPSFAVPLARIEVAPPAPEPNRELQKKQAAKSAAEKLSAKNKPPAAQESLQAPQPQPVAKAEPAPTATKNAAAPPKAQTQPAAVALSVAQLDALRALRANEDEDESRDRWLALFFMLLFVLLLQYGTPLLCEPDFETARATFGPKLRLATSVFAVFAVVGTVRAIVAHSQRGSLIQRVRGLVLQVVTGCILLVTATLYSSAPGLGLAAGFGRRMLPWGMGMMFFFLASDFARRGVRQVTTQLVYGVLALALAGGSVYGSYHSVLLAMQGEKKRAAALLAKRGADGLNAPSAGVIDGIKSQLTAESSGSSQQPRGDVDSIKQRHELGAGEEQDLMPASELEANRANNQKALEGLRDRLPSLGTEAPASPASPSSQ